MSSVYPNFPTYSNVGSTGSYDILYLVKQNLILAKRWNALEAAITEQIQIYAKDKNSFAINLYRELIKDHYPEFLDMIDKYIILI